MQRARGVCTNIWVTTQSIDSGARFYVYGLNYMLVSIDAKKLLSFSGDLSHVKNKKINPENPESSKFHFFPLSQPKSCSLH